MNVSVEHIQTLNGNSYTNSFHFFMGKKEKTIEKRRKRRSKNLNNIIYNEWLYVCVYSAHNTHKHKHTVGKEKKI